VVDSPILPDSIGEVAVSPQQSLPGRTDVDRHPIDPPTHRYRQDNPATGGFSMKKLFALVLCGSVALGLFVLGPKSAEAIPQFKTEFDKLYVKKDSTDPKDKALAEAVGKVKCNVCHVGKSKKDRNAYGEELSKLLDKKTDKKNVEKIKQALEKVGGMPSDAANPSAPTFGDRIKNGELPCPE
jgi:hypothetical protein